MTIPLDFYACLRFSKKSNIFDLAHAFLSIESMTHHKFQKLCYFAKTWYLAIYDENLIHESFEAWRDGPMNQDLDEKYRKYEFDCIPKYTDIKSIPERFLSFAKEVYEVYGEYDTYQLEIITRHEDPWLNARKGLKCWQNSHNVISEEDMKLFYRAEMSE